MGVQSVIWISGVLLIPELLKVLTSRAIRSVYFEVSAIAANAELKGIVPDPTTEYRM
jgi:hypothetical protein